MTEVAFENPRCSQRSLLIALFASVLLSFSVAARAQVPPELQGPWSPCKWEFTGDHPHFTADEWKLGDITFRVGKEAIGHEEYYFDVVGSLTNNMQDMTLHIVNGDKGLLPQKHIKPADVCDSPKLDLRPVEGDFMFMIGIAELASKDGEETSPHVVLFFPMDIAEGQRHFAMDIWHLPFGKESVTALADFLVSEEVRCGWSDGNSREKQPSEPPLAESDPCKKSGKERTDEQTGERRPLKLSLMWLLLNFLNHNGIVHGPG
jgi:hypothetical protein